MLQNLFLKISKSAKVFSKLLFISFSNRKFPDDSKDMINWSHIDGLFDLITSAAKQTLIETDEKV